jgi:hypothetical protein
MSSQYHSNMQKKSEGRLITLSRHLLAATDDATGQQHNQQVSGASLERHAANMQSTAVMSTRGFAEVLQNPSLSLRICTGATVTIEAISRGAAGPAKQSTGCSSGKHNH